VPPFGHTTHLRVFIDPDLLQYDEVWAAAGTWHDVFGIEPHQLVEASEGLVVDLKRGRHGRPMLATWISCRPSRTVAGSM
jgi:hypothetical protein